jgi:putative hydrolase of the HAD superfamily
MPTQLRGPYRVVFLDIGETLVHASPPFEQVAVEVAAALGATVDPGSMRDSARQSFERVVTLPSAERYTINTARSKAFWTSFYADLGRAFDIRATDDFARRLYQRFTRFEAYAPIPGAVATLRRLNRLGARLVAASNWEGWLDLLLAHLKLDRFFHSLVVSGRIGVEKPDRRFFEQALRQAGVAASEAVHVGDSYLADIEGARQADIDAIWLNTGGAPARDCPSITDLAQLPELLRNHLAAPPWTPVEG